MIHMIVKEFLELPPFIEVEGVRFELRIFNDGGTELRMGYIIAEVAADSPHRADYDQYGSWCNKIDNPIDPPLQGFLKLYGGIRTDDHLYLAIHLLWHWCEKNHFVNL